MFTFPWMISPDIPPPGKSPMEIPHTFSLEILPRTFSLGHFPREFTRTFAGHFSAWTFQLGQIPPDNFSNCQLSVTAHGLFVLITDGKDGFVWTAMNALYVSACQGRNKQQVALAANYWLNVYAWIKWESWVAYLVSCTVTSPSLSFMSLDICEQCGLFVILLDGVCCFIRVC